MTPDRWAAIVLIVLGIAIVVVGCWQELREDDAETLDVDRRRVTSPRAHGKGKIR